MSVSPELKAAQCAIFSNQVCLPHDLSWDGWPVDGLDQATGKKIDFSDFLEDVQTTNATPPMLSNPNPKPASGKEETGKVTPAEQNDGTTDTDVVPSTKNLAVTTSMRQESVVPDETFFLQKYVLGFATSDTLNADGIQSLRSSDEGTHLHRLKDARSGSDKELEAHTDSARQETDVDDSGESESILLSGQTPVVGPLNDDPNWNIISERIERAPPALSLVAADQISEVIDHQPSQQSQVLFANVVPIAATHPGWRGTVKSPEAAATPAHDVLVMPASEGPAGWQNIVGMDRKISYPVALPATGNTPLPLTEPLDARQHVAQPELASPALAGMVARVSLPGRVSDLASDQSGTANLRVLQDGVHVFSRHSEATYVVQNTLGLVDSTVIEGPVPGMGSDLVTSGHEKRLKIPLAAPLVSKTSDAANLFQAPMGLIQEVGTVTSRGSEDVFLASRMEFTASQSSMLQPAETAPLRLEISRNLVQQMKDASLRAAERPVDVHLNPEELGKVRISMVIIDSAITMNILAERPETLDLIRRHIDQLAQELRLIGYGTIGFSFGQQRQGREEGRAPPGGTKTNAETVVSATWQHDQNKAHHVSGLDIRI